MKERVEYIDLIKGIGIILVVIGHLLSVNTEVRRIIFTFHMPLFFFMAGLFHKPQKIGAYTAARIKRLLVPYFFFFFVAEVYTWGYDLLTKGVFVTTTWTEIFTGCEYFTYNVPLWFLLCLFEVTFLYNIILCAFPRKILIQSFIVLGISLIGYLLGYWSYNIPYFIDSAFSSLIFYHIGFLFYKYQEKFVEKHCSLKRRIVSQLILLTCNKKCFCWGRILLVLGAFILLSRWSGNVDIRSNKITSNYFVFIGTAFSGIFFVVFLCKQINSIRLIEYIGRNSLVIMATHVPIFLLANYFNNNVLRIGESVFYEVVRIIDIFILCLGLAAVMNRYIPKFIGKWR